jgi:hypothetical protein
VQRCRNGSHERPWGQSATELQPQLAEAQRWPRTLALQSPHSEPPSTAARSTPA